MDLTRRDLGRGLIATGTLAALPGLARSETVTTSHGVSAFGDLKYPADFTMFDHATPDAPVGGTFSTGYGGVTYDSLNPFILKGNAAIGLSGFCYDTLMAGGGDEPDAVYGLVAATVRYPESREWVEFDLRPEAKFADGSPITAEDVAFSFETLIEQGHPSYRVLFGAVLGASVPRPGTVRFEFDPRAALRSMPMTVGGLPILSKAYYTKYDFSESNLTVPLTSGPYAVETVEPGRTIGYRRRADYWGWHVPVNRGRYHFERVRIEYFLDRSVAFEAFKAGTFTFQEEFWSKLWATGYDFPAVREGSVVRDTIPDERPSGTQGYWFNLRRPVLQDARVREAIGLCFDFEWSNKTLFYGLYTRTDSFFEGGGELEASGAPSPAELRLLEPLASDLPPGVLEGTAYVPPVTDGSGRNRRNLRDAARLLDEAGWTLKDGQRVNADGAVLSVEFLSDSPSFTRITVPFTEQLKKIGIDARMREVDAAQYKRRMDEYDFDITVDRKAMSLTPGVELRDYFHSSSATSSGSENLAGVANPAVDALIDRIERAESRADLVAAVNALDRVLRAMHIWVPQWSKASHHLAFWDIYGRPATKPKYSRGVIDYWWFDAEKAAKLSDRIKG